MTKKRNDSSRKAATPTTDKSGQADAAAVLAETPADALLRYWPRSFAAPRRALFLVFAAVLLTALLMGLAAVGGFTAVKEQLAGYFELMRPEAVSRANYDMAMVITGLCAVTLLGLIHPCLGLGVLLAARAWLDGYTFPADNIYFTWSILILGGIWLARVLRGRESLRIQPPLLLFGGFLFVLLVVLRYSNQYHISYQLLWLWMGYGLLLLLTANMARDRKVAGLLLLFFLAPLGVQAVFSILHLNYLLPYMRSLIQNPAILQQYFNTSVITPELARRFMVNRAFGTMLFPNALAAYLLLGIPFACIMCVPAWRAWRTRVRTPLNADAARDRIVLACIMIAAGMLAFLAVFFVAHFPQSYRDEAAPLPVYLSTPALTVFALIAALGAALATLYLLQRMGLTGGFLFLRFLGLLVLAPLALYTLWITYSRGAFLALLLAVGWGGLLYWVRLPRTVAPPNRAALRKSAVLLLALVVLSVSVLVWAAWLAPSGAWAQTAPETAAAPTAPTRTSTADPRTQLRQEGLSLSASDLADPASLRLRLGYWRVALRMAGDNFLTGVGLGNFASAYPVYQFIGAGDVREAHNGYVQMFAEAGVFGGSLFLMFWLYFGVWGALRIVREQDASRKRALLGLYVGLVAFCLHAFLDINFSHPSLMLFAMILAGVFYGQAQSAASENSAAPDAAAPEAGAVPGARAAACVLLLLLVMVAYASQRVYVQQLLLNRFSFINVADDEELNRRMRTGQTLFAEIEQYQVALWNGEQPKDKPRFAIPQISFFLDDLEQFMGTCGFYKPSPDQSRRFLRTERGEPVPDNGIMIVATEPLRVRRKAFPMVENWIAELERIDKRFPHSPDLALHIAKWYELCVTYARRTPQEHRNQWITHYLAWADAVQKRNPLHADLRMFYGNALLAPALHEPGAATEPLVKEALSAFDEMVRLSPISPSHRYAYAGALDRLATHYTNASAPERASEYAQQAAHWRAEAHKLEKERQEAHLYP